MFFQVSPGIQKNPKRPTRKNVDNDDSRVEVVSLAPFTSSPKLEFNNVLVGTEETRKLLVKNPTGSDIDLLIQKHMPDDMDVVLSWNECLMRRGTERLLEVTWRPTKEDACRYKLVFCDGHQMKRNIFVIFKSVELKQPKASGTDKNLKNSKPKSSNLKLTKKAMLPSKKFHRNTPIMATPLSSSSKNGKENISPVPSKQQLQSTNLSKVKTSFSQNVSKMQQNNVSFNTDFFAAQSDVTFNIQVAVDNRRRETFAVCHRLSPSENSFRLQMKNREDTFDIQQNISNSKQMIALEHSGEFSDSLESPLLKNQQTAAHTPNLELLIRRANGSNYGMKLSRNNLVISPIDFGSSCNGFKHFTCPSTSTPASANNSAESPNMAAGNLFVQSQLEGTYLKNNVSSQTYVANNSSSETYTQADLSGGTYVKDESDGLLDVSPCPTTEYIKTASTFVHPRRLDLSTSNGDLPFEPNLSTVAEESGLSLLSRRDLRIGMKRKSSIVGGQPNKRERTQGLPLNADAFRISKSTSGLNLKQFPSFSYKGSNCPISSISETTTKTLIVRNPFLYANIIDPFMTSSIYGDEDWLNEQERNFEKWLNTLLTSPKELRTKSEVDVAKIWQECTKKQVPSAPSKEHISIVYHVNKKLDHLRKQAQNLFRSKEMSDVLHKVCLVVESGKLSIRSDKDIHLNLKLKSEIIHLLLGYNPLWLRIGLETIYNEVIPLRSNSDSQGLASFLLERFLKDPYLLKKYKTMFAPNYTSELKKLILKKFLILVYFLDQAKAEKLIQHDPCLFCKNAVEKESKQMLIHFARETLSAVGDITKYLRCLGYVVTHSQSYIHEFEYGIQNLGVDLRDGVRLAKVMEIIQMRNDLTPRLRVPAISRLQKIYNLQLVFTALQESGYEIMYDIVAKDIVDGHRNKTLSFLWQIIYKFEAPLMVKSATTIQTWYRSLPVQLKRLQLQRKHQHRENAAKRIQSWYRCQKRSKFFYMLADLIKSYIQEQKQLCAAIKLQSFFRMMVCRRNYKRLRYIILKLQANSKGWLIRNNYKQRIDAAITIQKIARRFIYRRKFLQLKQAVLILQARYRARKSMIIAKQTFMNLKTSALIIQRKFRASILMKSCYKEYAVLKQATIQIQSFYRMYYTRKQFIKTRTASIVIQRKYRAIISMRIDKQKYMTLRKAVLSVQIRFRAQRDMKQARNTFLLQKAASVYIQSRLRMIAARNRYVKLQRAVCLIQQKYRAYWAMKVERRHYIALRSSVVIVQRRFRANRLRNVAQKQYLIFRRSSIVIQSYYKMYKVRKYFTELTEVVVFLQRRFVSRKLMEKDRQSYRALKKAAIRIQQQWRAVLKGRQEYQNYTQLKNAVVTIQQTYRANKLMLLDRQRYIKIKSATIKIQTWYRSKLSMRICRQWYCLLKNKVLIIEQRFIALKLMRFSRAEYVTVRNATVIIQRHYKAMVEMRTCRASFLELKRGAIVLQRRYRANQIMKMHRYDYEKLRKAAKYIQMHFRAKKETKLQRDNFILQKTSAIRIQRWFHSVKEMRKCRNNFVSLKRAVAIIKSRFDAKRQMQIHSTSYGNLRKATIFIQRYYRNVLITRLCRKEFLKKRNAARKIQRWIRNVQYTRKLSYMFQQLRTATLFVQRTYRAKRSMIQCKSAYATLRNHTVFIQTKYRAKTMMQLQRTKFLRYRSAAVQIQQHYKANILMRHARAEYTLIRRMALVIQQKYRANITMRKEKSNFEEMKKYTIFIQRRYRANKAAKLCRAEYVTLRTAAIAIQTRFKARRLAISCVTQYSRLKWAALVLQHRFRAQTAMKVEMKKYLQLKSATFVIQRRFRASVLSRTQRSWFLKFKYSVNIIQMHFKSYLKMKRQRELYLKLHSGTICIQNFAKGYLIRKKCAPCLTKEAIQIRHVLKIRNKAAITIQATWRGYSLRKSEIPQLVSFRKKQQVKLSEPRKVCQSRTLAQRCEAAMICMTTKNSSLLMIMNALEDLEFITRHCREVCIRLSYILPDQLYIIIVAAARSLPEMSTLNVATLILITFCKYSKTHKRSFNADCIDDMINVMLHWCDKEAPLFCTMCTLLWLFAHSDIWKKIILGLPNIEQRLLKIQNLVIRKQNMVFHSKMNNLHSVFAANKDALSLPTRTANWGLDYDKPVTFKNATFAFNCLLRVLDLL